MIEMLGLSGALLIVGMLAIKLDRKFGVKLMTVILLVLVFVLALVLISTVIGPQLPERCW